jgi:chromosome segregation ATPase
VRSPRGRRKGLIAALEVRFVSVQADQIEDQEREARARAEELREPAADANRAYQIAAQQQGEAQARLDSALNEAEHLSRQLVGVRASLASMEADLQKSTTWR